MEQEYIADWAIITKVSNDLNSGNNVRATK